METDNGAAPLTQRERQAQVEAVLFATPQPVELETLCQLLGEEDAPLPADEAMGLIRRLEDRLLSSNSALTVQSIAGGFRLSTRSEHADLLRRLVREQRSRGLSPAALETLSIVAYRQPTTRMDVEAIRGVGCDQVLRSLLERGLVRICGRKQGAVGRPLLYGTTALFLETFGLPSLEDLPELEPTLAAPPPVEDDAPSPDAPPETP